MAFNEDEEDAEAQSSSHVNRPSVLVEVDNERGDSIHLSPSISLYPEPIKEIVLSEEDVEKETGRDLVVEELH